MVECAPRSKATTGHSGRLTLLHHFQYVGVYSDNALGDSGDRGGDITRRIWESGTEARDVILCIRRDPHLPLDITA